MNSKVFAIIALTVGVILAGSVLAPVIQDAQRSAGDPETISNPVQHNSYLMGEISGDKTVTYSLSSSQLYVNGAQVPISHSGTVGVLAMGPDGYVGVRNNGTALYYFEATSAGYTLHTIETGATLTLTATSVSDGTSTWPITSMWACGVATESPVFGTFPNGSGDAILNNISQVFGWAEVTLADSSKTIVAFSGNSASAEGHSVTVEATTSEYEGYADAILLEDYALVVDGASVPVTFALMPATIVAHEASGGLYNLYGVIPVMVILVLLISAVSIIRTKP